MRRTSRRRPRAGISASSRAAQLIVPAQQGRHRYFRLAGAHVAAMLESISAVAAIAPPRLRPIRIDDTMRKARMCYDHIAGELGVTLADALREHHHIEFADDGGVVTDIGRGLLRQARRRSLGGARQPPRVLPPVHRLERAARPSRRRGRRARWRSRLMELRWIARKRDTRALTITPVGWSKIERTFGCSLHDHAPRPALRLVAG